MSKSEKGDFVPTRRSKSHIIVMAAEPHNDLVWSRICKAVCVTTSMEFKMYFRTSNVSMVLAATLFLVSGSVARAERITCSNDKAEMEIVHTNEFGYVVSRIVTNPGGVLVQNFVVGEAGQLMGGGGTSDELSSSVTDSSGAVQLTFTDDTPPTGIDPRKPLHLKEINVRVENDKGSFSTGFVPQTSCRMSDITLLERAGGRGAPGLFVHTYKSSFKE